MRMRWIRILTGKRLILAICNWLGRKSSLFIIECPQRRGELGDLISEVIIDRGLGLDELSEKVFHALFVRRLISLRSIGMTSLLMVVIGMCLMEIRSISRWDMSLILKV